MTTSTDAKRLSFDDLTEIAPSLGQLYNCAKCYPVKEGYCPTPTWYREFKPRLIKLVGWNAEDKRLQNTVAYDLAYKTVCEALPECPKNCRDCD